MTPEFLLGRANETAIYEAVLAHLSAVFPDVTVKCDKTQAAFVRQTQFAWVWHPRRRSMGSCRGGWRRRMCFAGGGRGIRSSELMVGRLWD